MTQPVRSVLVYVGLDLVGDGLMKLPFVRGLRAAFPDAHITWLAGKGKSVYAGSLAPLVSGYLDQVVEDANIGSQWREVLSRPLGGQHFDLILDTQRRLLTTLILHRTRHNRMISGAANFLLSDVRPTTSRKVPGMVGQMMQLLELACGQPPDLSQPLRLPPDCLAEAVRLLPDGLSYVGLAPGAGGRHKCWPLDRYLDLAQRLSQQGHQPVIFLGPNETEWEASITAAVPDAILPLQRTSQPSPMLTIALGQRLRAAIANDAGVGHMLAAADCPLVSLFGPTPAAKFAPMTKRLTVVKAQDFGGDAMDFIPIEAVYAAIARSLV